MGFWMECIYLEEADKLGVHPQQFSPLLSIISIETIPAKNGVLQVGPSSPILFTESKIVKTASDFRALRARKHNISKNSLPVLQTFMGQTKILVLLFSVNILGKRYPKFQTTMDCYNTHILNQRLPLNSVFFVNQPRHCSCMCQWGFFLFPLYLCFYLFHWYDQEKLV